MNLTFYENSKESKNNSFSPSLEKLNFPSIFSKFETEKNFFRDSLSLKLAKNKIYLPRYKNIAQEILRVKKQFRNLFDIKNSIFKEMITKKNSTTYKNFIKGFGKYFFGPFGFVTQKNKFLRDHYLRISALNDKIFAGRLEYFDYINKYNRYRQRKNIANKHILSISKNYEVVTDRSNIYSVKAGISNRYFNQKDFISLNRLKYRNSITEKNETSPNIKIINEVMNKTLSNKNKNINHKKKVLNKSKNKPSLYLKTFNNFYYNKKRNLLGNYIKAVSDFKNINKGFNSNTRTNSHINIKFSKEKINAGNSSNLFLTQGSQSNKQFLNHKISFNRLINLKRSKTNLNKFSKSINYKNVSFKI